MDKSKVEPFAATLRQLADDIESGDAGLTAFTETRHLEGVRAYTVHVRDTAEQAAGPTGGGPPARHGP